MRKKPKPDPANALRLFAQRKRSGTLPGIRIVLPSKDPAVGFEIRLLDPKTGEDASFGNTAGLEIVLERNAGPEDTFVRIGLQDVVTGEMRRRLLSGGPLIARVTHLYEIESVEEEA